MGAQLILLSIEDWVTRNSSYKIWLYILRNFVWLSYLNIEVLVMKQLTVACVQLPTVRVFSIALKFMFSSPRVWVIAVTSGTAEAPYCISWRKFCSCRKAIIIILNVLYNLHFWLLLLAIPSLLSASSRFSNTFLCLKTLSLLDKLRIMW